MGTFGPTYDAELDGERLRRQLERVREFMLPRDDWQALYEIAAVTGDPEGSISADLRHLRKEQFGSYDVKKRRRVAGGALWEYRVDPPLAIKPKQKRSRAEILRSEQALYLQCCELLQRLANK